MTDENETADVTAATATDAADAHDEEAQDDDHRAGTGEYDPAEPTPPAREPPVRSTAPQSDYTTGQVALGIVIFLGGIALAFGLPLVMG